MFAFPRRTLALLTIAATLGVASAHAQNDERYKAVMAQAGAGSFEAGWVIGISDLLPISKAMEAAFPDDWLRMVGRVAADLGPVSRAELAPRIAQLMTPHIAAFAASHGNDVAHAPPKELLAMSAARADLLRRMRRLDVAGCARLANGVAGPISPALAAPFNRNGVQFMATAKAGLMNPTRYAEPTEADWQAQKAAMRATGLDEATLKSAGMADATDAQTCDIAVAMYAAPARLPREQGARLASTLFQPAIRPAQ